MKAIREFFHRFFDWLFEVKRKTESPVRLQAAVSAPLIIGDDIPELLGTLAHKAWTVEKTRQHVEGGFLFNPATKLSGEESNISAALQSLYIHAREWAPGLEVPYNIPKLRLTGLLDAAGQFEVDGDGWLTIRMSPEFLSNPATMWLILAHEVCHHILTQSGLDEQSNKIRNERKTDLTMFVCGFGGLVQAGYTNVRRTPTGYLQTHLGYLDANEYSHAFHWVISARHANGLAGVERMQVSYPDLASGFKIVDVVTALSQKLRTRIYDAGIRERLIKYYRDKFPDDSEEERINRIIDGYERDRR